MTADLDPVRGRPGWLVSRRPVSRRPVSRRNVNLRHVGRRTVLAAVAALVAVAVVVTSLVVVLSGGSEYRITARFVATPGLYPHNSVDILGVPSGHIVSVTPHDSYVEVVMAIPDHIKIPATAEAVLMAPNPVSDRFVELSPPYTGGPALAPGANVTNTVVPLELDQVYQSVDQLSKLLGPAGANQGGDLSAALHAFAQLASGNGADLHTAIDSIAAALPALTAHPDQLAALVNGLDTLTKTLAQRNATIDSLYGDLATATSQFAGERATISAAITNLQQGLQQVAAFIQANQANLTGSVRNLATTVSAVMQEQRALIATFDTAPLGFQNFNYAIDPNAACVSATGAPHNCASLWGRLDFTRNVTTLLGQYCGGILASFLPILEWNANLADATARETTCGAELGLLQNRVGPAGSPNTPDLDLSHYLGS